MHMIKCIKHISVQLNFSIFIQPYNHHAVQGINISSTSQGSLMLLHSQYAPPRHDHFPDFCVSNVTTRWFKSYSLTYTFKYIHEGSLELLRS